MSDITKATLLSLAAILLIVGLAIGTSEFSYRGMTWLMERTPLTQGEGSIEKAAQYKEWAKKYPVEYD